MEICKSRVPPSFVVAPDHSAACWLHVDPAERRANPTGFSAAATARDALDDRNQQR
jgi:hypothetical protein